MNSYDNPLRKLIEINNNYKDESQIIHDLIELTLAKITITEKDIFEDTFTRPMKSTFIYSILFKDCFRKLSIYEKVIQEMDIMWTSWKEIGLYAHHIMAWKKQNTEQREIANHMWNLIQVSKQKPHSFELMLEEVNEEFKTKNSICNIILSCIEEYCQNANDKDNLVNQIQNIQKKLMTDTVCSVEIPSEFIVLAKCAKEIIPYSKCQIWQNFLTTYRNQPILYSQASANPILSVDKSDKAIASSTEINVKSIESEKQDNEIHLSYPKSCYSILQADTKLFHIFINRLIHSCSKWEILPISQSIKLFPNMHNDLDYLKHNFNVDIIKFFTTLFDYNKNLNYINHICQGCINLFDLFQIQLDNSKTMLTDVLQMNENTNGKTFLTIYQTFHQRIYVRYSRRINEIFSYYGSALELVKFLYSLSASDVDNLRETVNGWDETLINTKTILDLVTLKTFLDQLSGRIKMIQEQSSSILTLDRVTACIERLLEDDQWKTIFECFESCHLLLPSIQHIYMNLTDRRLSKRRQILNIMKNVSFSFKSHDQQELKQLYGLNYNYDITINFNELSDLRDRARLIEYSHRIKIQNDTEQDTEMLHSFVSFVDTIENIIKNLTQLKMIGYPCVQSLLEPSKTFTCIEGKYNELIEFEQTIEKLRVEWEYNLCELYKQHISLTYFFYEQFWIIEQYLYNRTTVINNAYHLLKYIGIQPELIQYDFLLDMNQDPVNRLKKVGQVLSTQKTKIIETNEQKYLTNNRVLLVQTSDEGIMRAILSLFTFVQVPAKVNQLFYCTNRTTWMEVCAFVYRCFYSEKFHQLIRPELLTLSIQDKFIELLTQMISWQQPEHHFQFGIITTSSNINQLLINNLKALELVQEIFDYQMLNVIKLKEEIEKLNGKTCFLVTSNIAGLGKSTTIRNIIHNSGKEYIKFPISGNIDMKSLVTRFCNCANNSSSSSSSSKIAIHIDIGIINDINQLNEFLYSVILFRSFRYESVAINVCADVPIYIELDSSPQMINLYEKIIILQNLEKHQIPLIEWNQMNIHYLAGIKLVINYLQAIDKQIINQTDINEENLEEIDKMTCAKLLRKQFIGKKDDKQISWTRLKILVTIYNYLFSGFSKCGYFLSEFTKNSQLRMDILQYLLKSSDQFTSLSVESVRKNQRSTSNDNLKLDEAIIRWDKLQPFTVIFTDSNDPLFVFKKRDDIPRSLINAAITPVRKRFFNRFLFFNKEKVERQQQKQQELLFPDHNQLKHSDFFMRLASLSSKYFIKSVCNICFKQHEYNVQICMNCGNKGQLIRPKKEEEEFKDSDIKEFQLKFANIFEKEYVWTPDNYVKALLIYLRVQCRLPVILIGETGCGKTALIQFLCEKILDDELAVFRIHAGITNETIIEKMFEFQIKANQCLNSNKNKRLWIFFDEFNTTSSIGLFKEIICERTLLGEPLPDNLVFLGACNPQRWRKNKNIHDNIGIKKDPYDIQRLNARLGRESLIYHVVPIPETMLEYTWDYGFLDGETEIVYIRTMLNKCNKISDDMSWFDCIVSLVAISQQFFRTNEDKSSVSLRDVARFCRFYNWLLNLSPEFIYEHSRIMNQEFIQQTTLVALLLTYYLRLSSSELRESYLNNISVVLNNKFQNISNISRYLIRLLQNQQMKLIDKIKLPSGTAINRALIDNIFVIFACVLNRIPVILCGKPGSSKTLAVNIVLNNLKGKRSNQKLFQTLPELIPISYQGSQNCTSENVMKLFECAEKYLDVEINTNILPVIVFDEIGLAELSSHNPLKVLHSKLEMETCRYGFIGISNWSLDAAKMNRALYLPCADPTVHDLRLTAETIASSLLETSNHLIPIDTSIVRNLAAAYFDLYEYMNEQSKYKNYFGLRDFYSLIKGVVNDLIHASTEQESYTSVRRQLGINFDGIFDGSQFLWERFCKYAHKEYLIEQEQSLTFNQMIDRSLSLHNGRYLMLIGENESMFNYVERYINAKQQSTRIIIGSSLTDDLIAGTTYSEQYNQRILMDIILHAETNVTLIMRRMNHIYANLYDLFNQNFNVSGSKKYCRITLGAFYQPCFLVHDDFFCIICIRQQDLINCDPPFLNRFEKHIIDIESLIHSYHLIVASNFLEWIDKLLSYNSNKNFPQKKHLFVDFNPDYICNLVMDAYDYLKISEDDNEYRKDEIIQYCQQKLIRTSSFDFPLYLSCKINNDDDNDQIQKLIEQYYNIHNNLSFFDLIDQSLNQSIISNQIIYTYTQIYEKIEYIHNNDLVVEVKIGNFKSEFELRRMIQEHYRSNNTRLLLIRVDYHEEYKHILFLKHLVANERIPISNHGVWLIFHLQRNIMHEIKNDILFNGWSPVMIDNLNKHKLISLDVLTNPSYRNLLLHTDFSLSNITFNELISRSFIRVRYTVACKDKEYLINNRRDSIIKLLSQSNIDTESLHMIIKNRLLELIRTVDFNHSRSKFIDWRHDLLTNGTIIGSCRSIDDALRMTILLYYCIMLWIDLEKSSLIDSYMFLMSKKNDIIYENLKSIWFDCLKLTFESMEQTFTYMNTIEISLIFDLHLPRARFEREIIRQINEMITKPNENIDINLPHDQLLRFAMEKLRSTSIYGKNIENILDNLELFEHYYHDQIAIILDEIRIDHLTVSFAQRLLTSNPTLTVEDKLKHLLLYHNELIELLHLFEIGIELIGKENWNFDEQFYIYDMTKITSINNSSNLYILAQIEQQFYQAPPQQSLSDKSYECAGDPFIETSLMNLIELLLSSSIIDRMDNIAQLSTTYSLIVQGVLALDHYNVNNLEKLRSFDSLVRCIMDLLSNDRALIVFKNICLPHQNSTVFNGNFPTYDTIHVFINRLSEMIKIESKNSLNLLNCRSLLKLEMEFLKNWLIDHSEQYCTVLEHINKSDKNLWFYSAKIFKYIDQKLHLMSIIKTRMTELSSISELENLDQYFYQSNDKKQKIECIMINRIYVSLMSFITDEDMIEKYLIDYYDYFRENIYSNKSNHGLSMIVSIAWLKVYTEMYAYSLSRDNHSMIMEDIDKLLTEDQSKFGLTLKIYIIKQLCQMYHIKLEELYDIFVNRNCYWIKEIFSRYSQQQGHKFKQNIILPTPLFEGSQEYINMNKTLDNNELVYEMKNLIERCSNNQHASYCFIMTFVHHYVNFYTTNKCNDDHVQLIEKLQTDLNKCFEPIGYKLLVLLCQNFSVDSYYHLNQTMSLDMLHRRLLALNIVAIFLSFKAYKNSTFLSSILFDERLKMPKNYVEHLENSICLPSLISN
ncbi:unnamed protein product, partial [Rotaria sordida]